MKTRIKVYLSGPITGTDDYEERFSKAEKYVKELFHWGKCIVVNPVKIGKKLDLKRKPWELYKWSDYMRACIKFLPECNFVFMLKNFENSKGAMIEKKLANDLGIKIILEGAEF